MKIKKVMLGLVGLAAVATLAACSSNSSSSSSNKVNTVEKGTLTVAISPDYPPFEYKNVVNGKDTIVGIDVDLAKEIAKKMDLKLELSSMSFNNVLGAVSAGKADLAISGITKTPERAKSFDFSTPYYQPVNEIIIKKSNYNKFNTLEDFKGLSVAGQTGSTQATAIQKQMKSANLVQLVSGVDEINEVKAGKVAGTVMDSMPAESYVSQNSDLAVAKPKLPMAKGAATCIAMKKDSGEMKKEVDATIKALKKSGKLDEIIKKDYAASQKKN